MLERIRKTKSHKISQFWFRFKILVSNNTQTDFATLFDFKAKKTGAKMVNMRVIRLTYRETPHLIISETAGKEK